MMMHCTHTHSVLSEKSTYPGKFDCFSTNGTLSLVAVLIVSISSLWHLQQINERSARVLYVESGLVERSMGSCHYCNRLHSHIHDLVVLWIHSSHCVLFG